MRETGKQGVEIENIERQSPAYRAGIRKGDILVSVNGHPIRDVIDYLFAREGGDFSLDVSRGGQTLSFDFECTEGEYPGIGLKQFRTRRCNNKCIFCFVDQLPKGLRPTLYLKDEDYRMSFLYGNYICLTNLSTKDRERILRQRLSPLYISVHTTNNSLRRKMIGNPIAPDIMRELEFFGKNKITMHAQVVLCPGYNDGAELKKTIRDLGSLYPSIASVAIVPVGLTAYFNPALRPVTPEDAHGAVKIISAMQERFLKKQGNRVVYGSDELYLKAHAPLPRISEYDDLPQLENGVGMVRNFMEIARRTRLQGIKGSRRRLLTFTGLLFYPFLKRFTDRLGRYGIKITPAPVVNSFFGERITVTGLLTGRDIINALRGISGNFDAVLVPDVVLREGRDVFLDDVTLEDISSKLGIEAIKIDSTPDGIINVISNGRLVRKKKVG